MKTTKKTTKKKANKFTTPACAKHHAEMRKYQQENSLPGCVCTAESIICKHCMKFELDINCCTRKGGFCTCSLPDLKPIPTYVDENGNEQAL